MMSMADPEKSAEGGLDPLGLYGIADELALLLCPGVRERQRRLRYLTMQAVSLELCAAFDADRLAKDRRTEPWLVFEWHVVEGLVRHGMDGESLSLPGSQKAKQAVDRGLALSAETYLKTAAAFGFHGVYRLLARDLGIEEAEVLGGAGRELLNVWEQEQDLRGFGSSSSGRGADLKRQWRDAVEEGLQQGKTARSGGWEGWRKISQHLHPLHMGAAEAGWFKQHLLADSKGHRGELLRFYRSRDGQKCVKARSERAAHTALLEKSDNQALRVMLRAIQGYENFARLAQDAFDACLQEMVLAHGPVRVATLAQLDLVQRASRSIPQIFVATAELLARQSEVLAARFQKNFDSLQHASSTADWTALLLEHHGRVQRQKQPLAKNPWILSEGTAWRVRPLYADRKLAGADRSSYAHAYRMLPLSGFVADLQRATQIA